MTTKRERRDLVKQIAALLRSDLYERGTSHPDEDSEASATWWSPLKLSVTYGYNQEAEDQPVWIRCRNAEGKVYAETEHAEYDWLDRNML